MRYTGGCPIINSNGARVGVEIDLCGVLPFGCLHGHGVVGEKLPLGCPLVVPFRPFCGIVAHLNGLVFPPGVSPPSFHLVGRGSPLVLPRLYSCRPLSVVPPLCGTDCGVIPMWSIEYVKQEGSNDSKSIPNKCN